MSEQEMLDTAIGPLPTDWSVVKLGTVSSEGTERNRNLEFGRADVLGVDNQTGLGPSDRLLGDDFSRYKLVRKHQFAYNPMRLNVGSIGLWVKEKWSIVSPDYIVFGCKPNLLDPDYMDLFRRSGTWKWQIQQSGQGSVRIRYYYRHIAEFLIPLPPLREQQAIAHVLRTVQQAKEATEKVITAARQLKQSLMRHLFTYGPVPVDQADKVPLKESEFGFVPGHWPVLPVGEVCKSIVPGRTKPKAFDGTIPWITMPDLKGNVIVSRSVAGLALSKEAIAEVHAKVIPSGSVVMSCIGEFGIVVIVENDVVVNQQLHALICPSHLMAYFLCHALRMQKTFMERIAHFTTLPYLSKDKCNSVPIPVPPMKEQEGVVAALKAMDEKIECEEACLSAQSTLFQTLLHHLMTGKVRVNDVTLETANAHRR